jgi:RNA polymerase sigma-70 factor, ECF subfamily
MPAPDQNRTDRDLVDRLSRGDLGALETLYELYGAMAYSIAYRITGDRTAAEDVVQEAFLGAWRNAARYVDARGSVRTWLLSIVHHRAIDAIRRRRPTTELPDAEARLPASLTFPDTWTEVEQRLDRTAVLAALDSISAVQREAIELAYFGGLTQVEIAGRTGVPLGTVKGRMRLGLAGLRAALLAAERGTAGVVDG